MKNRIAGILGFFMITGIPGICHAIVIPDASTNTLRIQNGASLGIVGYGTSLSSVPVNVLNNITVTSPPGNNLNVNIASGIPYINASSNTALPASVNDGAPQKLMGDSHGRLIIQPVVPLPALKVATYTITTDTNERTFISSATAGSRNVITHCIGQNTSATATSIRLRPTFGSNVGSIPLGMPASNVPVGFNFPQGVVVPLAGNAWSIQAAGSVSSLEISCFYYQESP